LEKINKIHKRQLARFLDHLKNTGQLTPSLESDIKRSFGFIFQDVQSAIQEPDKENDYEIQNTK
jgi:hypothetical protein